MTRKETPDDSRFAIGYTNNAQHDVMQRLLRQLPQWQRRYHLARIG